MTFNRTQLGDTYEACTEGRTAAVCECVGLRAESSIGSTDRGTGLQTPLSSNTA